ncbi:hypothetical protein Tco_1537732 [Tanacetum coccineum]
MFEAFYERKCRSPVLWAEIRKSSLTGLEVVQETTDKVVLIKEKPKAARDRQKSYVDYRHKLLEFEVGPFKIIKRIGLVAYRLRLPEELNSVHDTFHVSNLKKCLADANLHMPLDKIKVDKILCFVEEPIKIMDQKIKRLKRRNVALVKVSCLWTELLSLLVKSRDEISSKREYCDIHDFTRCMISFEVYDHFIMSAFVFGDEYSICSRVVIMERNDVLHAMLRQ